MKWWLRGLWEKGSTNGNDKGYWIDLLHHPELTTKIVLVPFASHNRPNPRIGWVPVDRRLVKDATR